ncbi:MAG: hypothetical protein ACOC2C_01325, partial [Cyclonatronaceae bacterium]
MMASESLFRLLLMIFVLGSLADPAPRAALAQPAPDTAGVHLGQLEIEHAAAFSSSGNLPWWLHVHRDGRFGQGHGGFAYTGVRTRTKMPSYRGFTPVLHAAFFGRFDNDATLVFNEAFAEIRRHTLTFYGGYRPEQRGFTYGSLSTGSMGLSRNARPMPKIGLELDYTTVPFTGRFAEVKGHFAHGWFESDRYTNGPLLHEKSGYIRLGGDHVVNFHAGLVHFAVYGGSTPDFGDNPSGFSD